MLWRRTTYYEKSPQSPNEQWASDDSRTLRQYVINGDVESRYWAAQDFLGYATVEGVTVNGKFQYFISRVTPHGLQFANQRNERFLFAQAITRTEPLGVGELDDNFPELAGYTKAVITVEYRTVPWDVREDSAVLAGAANGSTLYDTGTSIGFPDEGDQLAAAPAFTNGQTPFAASRYVTRAYRPGVKFLMLKNGMMRYVDGTVTGTPIPEGIPYAIPFTTCSYVWMNVPLAAYPAKTIERALGTVNLSRFDGFTAQTLLLLSAVPRWGRDSFGNRIMDVEYTMKWQPNVSPQTGVPLGHNTSLRNVGGFLQYQLLSSDGLVTGDYTHRVTDFSLLFKPEQDLSP